MKSKTQGFSFIEVVLVLGIAGLIFMMSFIALPSLWASQRDADRRAMVMEFISSLKNYQTNNSRGASPIVVTTDGGNEFNLTDAKKQEYSPSNESSWKAFVKNYVSANFGGPDKDSLKFRIYNNGSTASGCTNTTNASLTPGTPCTNNPQAAGANGGSEPTSGVNNILYVFESAVCDGNQAVKSANSRDVAAIYILERSGRYCYNT